MRKEFYLSLVQLNKILEASKPVPYMVIGGAPTSSQQENANRAWAEVGKELGFDHMTVKPIPGKGQRFFSAEVVEGENNA